MQAALHSSEEVLSSAAHLPFISHSHHMPTSPIQLHQSGRNLYLSLHHPARYPQVIRQPQYIQPGEPPLHQDITTLPKPSDNFLHALFHLIHLSVPPCMRRYLYQLARCILRLLVRLFRWGSGGLATKKKIWKRRGGGRRNYSR